MSTKKVGMLVLVVVVVLLAILFVVLQGEEPVQEIVRPEDETVEILVANKDLALGSKTSASNFKWFEWSIRALPEEAILRSSRPDAPDELADLTVRGFLAAGDPVQESKLIDNTPNSFLSGLLSPGTRAFGIEVRSLSTAGGFIFPNDRVDIILSSRSEDEMLTGVVMTDIRVLAIDQNVASPEYDDVSLPARETATLELTPAQVEVLTRVQQYGTLLLALRPANEGNTVGVYNYYDDDDDGTVLFIKYGAISTIMPRTAAY